MLVAVPLLFLVCSRKAAIVAGLLSLWIVVLVVLPVYVRGWSLMTKAYAGDAEAQYDLARWTESHSEQINEMILWPCIPDVLGGFAWLEQAAAQDYGPAVWLVGVRLKHGIHVPEPPNWTGAGGNVFRQPDRGQQMIDRAIAMGFEPPEDEKGYYWHVYRRRISINYLPCVTGVVLVAVPLLLLALVAHRNKSAIQQRKNSPGA